MFCSKMFRDCSCRQTLIRLSCSARCPAARTCATWLALTRGWRAPSRYWVIERLESRITISITALYECGPRLVTKKLDY